MSVSILLILYFCFRSYFVVKLVYVRFCCMFCDICTSIARSSRHVWSFVEESTNSSDSADSTDWTCLSCIREPCGRGMGYVSRRRIRSRIALCMAGTCYWSYRLPRRQKENLTITFLQNWERGSVGNGEVSAFACVEGSSSPLYHRS